jgi:ATP-binding cassette subfamily B protein
VALRVLLRYLARHWSPYAGGILLLLVTNACALAIPWVVKDAVDILRAATGGRPAHRELAWAALLVVGLAAAQGVTRSASRLLLLGTAQRVEARLRADLFGRLLELEPAFYQAHRTGDLMSRATTDLQAVAMLVGFGFLSVVNTLVLYAGTLAAMLRLDPWLTAATLAPYPLLVALAKRHNTRAHAEALAVSEQLARLSARAQENLTGMAVVRAYTMQEREVRVFRRENGDYLARVLRQARTQGTFAPLMGMIGGLGALIVLWLGGWRVLDGRMTLGALVAFSSYVAYLAWPTMALGWVLAILRRGLTSLGRVADVLERRPAVASPPGAAAPSEIGGEIEVRRLTFAYGTDRPPALRDVSLRIAAGSVVAVVGPTGAGKTTLLLLLARLWDPPPGTVFLDGHDIRALPLPALREALGVVPQEPFLFSRPLAANVALGRPATPSTRLAWAAAMAGLAADIAELPDGWATLVGERGLALSGGQRQRATLARALVREPRLFVLDDVFASVDAEKEAAILRGLREALRGRTTILATHRLRAAREADAIVVLDAGRVVEQGSHEALLAAGGLYARLWRRQQLEAAVEAGR